MIDKEKEKRKRLQEEGQPIPSMYVILSRKNVLWVYTLVHIHVYMAIYNHWTGKGNGKLDWNCGEILVLYNNYEYGQ